MAVSPYFGVEKSNMFQMVATCILLRSPGQGANSARPARKLRSTPSGLAESRHLTAEAEYHPRALLDLEESCAQLGPPVERLEEVGTRCFFFVVSLSRGTLPTKKVGKRALLGDLVKIPFSPLWVTRCWDWRAFKVLERNFFFFCGKFSRHEWIGQKESH